MTLNLGIIALAAIIPLIVGSVWYNPKVLGNVWMKASGLSEDYLKKGNMMVIFGLTYVLCIMLGIVVTNMVIHQNGVASIFAEISDKADFNDFISKYGGLYRTFKHGVFHGVLVSLFFVLPVVGIISLFERRGFKYIAIHVGYWMISLALMGGVICQFS